MPVRQSHGHQYASHNQKTQTLEHSHPLGLLQPADAGPVRLYPSRRFIPSD